MDRTGLDASQIDYASALGLLRLLYGKALTMTDTVARDGYLISDDALVNHYYLANLATLNALLERSDFDEFRSATDFLLPTLVGDEEIDIEWEYGRKGAYEFLALIEGACLKNHVQDVVISPDLQKAFDAADEAVKNYAGRKSELNDKLPAAVDAAIEASTPKTLLITKDNRGDFSYNGKRIEMDKAAIYYEVFDALYSRCDQGGFASYEDIEKHLVVCGRPEMDVTGKRDKRIQNALNEHQGLFRYAKINDNPLKNKTLDGKELVEIVRGKGLKLNNTNI